MLKSWIVLTLPGHSLSGSSVAVRIDLLPREMGDMILR